MDLGDAMSELETFVWFGGHHVRIRDICMDLGDAMSELETFV